MEANPNWQDFYQDFTPYHFDITSDPHFTNLSEPDKNVQSEENGNTEEDFNILNLQEENVEEEENHLKLNFSEHLNLNLTVIADKYQV